MGYRGAYRYIIKDRYQHDKYCQTGCGMLHGFSGHGLSDMMELLYVGMYVTHKQLRKQNF